MPNQPTNFMTHLGVKVEAESTGHSKCRLTVRAEYFNRAGTVHGGFLMSLMDTLMGYAAHSVLPSDDNHIATTTMTTNFLEAVMEGELIGSGSVTAVTEQFVLSEARLHDHNGRLVATASGQFSRIRG